MRSFLDCAMCRKKELKLILLYSTNKLCDCFLNSHCGNVVQAACTKTLTPKQILQTSSRIEGEKQINHIPYCPLISQ